MAGLRLAVHINLVFGVFGQDTDPQDDTESSVIWPLSLSNCHQCRGLASGRLAGCAKVQRQAIEELEGLQTACRRVHKDA